MSFFVRDDPFLGNQKHMEQTVQNKTRYEDPRGGDPVTPAVSPHAGRWSSRLIIIFDHPLRRGW
jgi:hypothetical protein